MRPAGNRGAHSLCATAGTANPARPFAPMDSPACVRAASRTAPRPASRRHPDAPGYLRTGWLGADTSIEEAPSLTSAKTTWFFKSFCSGLPQKIVTPLLSVSEIES